MDKISQKLGKHYQDTFETHGPNSQGVDWGPDESKLALRYQQMLNVVKENNALETAETIKILDIGCGYGGLLTYLQNNNHNIEYTGIDLAGNMIDWAKKNNKSGKFISGDIFNYEFTEKFDYIVCNGILTQKLDVSGGDMDIFAMNLIKRMFALCTKGVAFNMMTTKVNFFSNNLYYKNPAELFAWCINEITPCIKLDHSYPLYEFTLYLYKSNGDGEV